MSAGGCLCGAIRYEMQGEPLWVAYCHCESCRRHTASPVALFVGMNATDVHWTDAAPTAYASSPGIERLFCAQCGTPVAYRADRFPGELHLYHGTLDHPDTLQPRGHVHTAEQLPWFEIHDDLPRYIDTGQGCAQPVRLGPRGSASAKNR